MKKVLLVCDGKHFSEGAFKMAACLQALQPVLLTGVFLGSEIFRYVYLDADYVAADIAGKLQEEEEELAQSSKRFIELYQKNGMEYRVHEEINFDALEHLKKEMRFADLAIIGSEMFYKNYDDKHPNSHLKAALHHAECPVLLVPEHIKATSGVILAYNGFDSNCTNEFEVEL